ncbi:cysteine-rich receptor-like protein kinase 8 [Tanacetum coccineum]
MVTVKALLAIAAMKGWDVCQMDVSNAFLHGDLFEEVYMKCPPGYVGQGESVKDADISSLLCKLKKSLYGLKQAPRQWFSKLSSALLSFGYKQSKADYSLFVKSDSSSFTAVLVYADDLLITGTSPLLIQELKKQLSNTFHMKDLADIGTPLPDPEVYRSLIGKLIYLTITRPDICYTVQLLSQFMQNPTSVHMQAVKHLLRYLLCAPGQGILLANSSAQQVVSRSSAEAEYRVMALTCSGVTWSVSLLKDLGVKDLGLVDLKCDNQVAIHIAANPLFHAKTKHIEVDCHYVRDQIKSGLVKPSYVSTKEQVADVFTKVLPTEQHHKLLSKLGVFTASHSQLEGSV